MGYLAYKVKVPQLMSQLNDRGLLVVRGLKKSSAQFLISVTGISPDKAYEAIKPREADALSMDVLWKIYAGLKAAGVTVLEKGKERPLSFEGDVFELLEVDD